MNKLAKEVHEIFAPLIVDVFVPVLKEIMDKELKATIERIEAEKKLPLILTDAHLRQLFSLSQTMIWQIKQLDSFPKFWMGIEGHYKTQEVLDWFDSEDGEEFKKQRKLLKMVK